MKNTKPGLLASIACIAAAAALPVAGAHASKLYSVVVTTNFGTTFDDCYTFKGGFKGGTLTSALIGQLIYTPAPRAEAKDYYTAVATASLVSSYGGSIAFSGYEMGMPGAISFVSVGADYAGDSYYLVGTETTSCSVTTSAPAGSNPYKP
jgi:hypothetical protein